MEYKHKTIDITAKSDNSNLKSTKVIKKRESQKEIIIKEKRQGILQKLERSNGVKKIIEQWMILQRDIYQNKKKIDKSQKSIKRLDKDIKGIERINEGIEEILGEIKNIPVKDQLKFLQKYPRFKDLTIKYKDVQEQINQIQPHGEMIEEYRQNVDDLIGMYTDYEKRCRENLVSVTDELNITVNWDAYFNSKEQLKPIKKFKDFKDVLNEIRKLKEEGNSYNINKQKLVDEKAKYLEKNVFYVTRKNSSKNIIKYKLATKFLDDAIKSVGETRETYGESKNLSYEEVRKMSKSDEIFQKAEFKVADALHKAIANRNEKYDQAVNAKSGLQRSIDTEASQDIKEILQEFMVILDNIIEVSEISKKDQQINIDEHKSKIANFVRKCIREEHYKTIREIIKIKEAQNLITATKEVNNKLKESHEHIEIYKKDLEDSIKIFYSKVDNISENAKNDFDEKYDAVLRAHTDDFALARRRHGLMQLAIAYYDSTTNWINHSFESLKSQNLRDIQNLSQEKAVCTKNLKKAEAEIENATVEENINSIGTDLKKRLEEKTGSPISEEQLHESINQWYKEIQEQIEEFDRQLRNLDDTLGLSDIPVLRSMEIAIQDANDQNKELLQNLEIKYYTNLYRNIYFRDYKEEIDINIAIDASRYITDVFMHNREAAVDVAVFLRKNCNTTLDKLKKGTRGEIGIGHVLAPGFKPVTWSEFGDIKVDGKLQKAYAPITILDDDTIVVPIKSEINPYDEDRSPYSGDAPTSFGGTGGIKNISKFFRKIIRDMHENGIKFTIEDMITFVRANLNIYHQILIDEVPQESNRKYEIEKIQECIGTEERKGKYDMANYIIKVKETNEVISTDNTDSTEEYHEMKAVVLLKISNFITGYSLNIFSTDFSIRKCLAIETCDKNRADIEEYIESLPKKQYLAENGGLGKPQWKDYFRSSTIRDLVTFFKKRIEDLAKGPKFTLK